MHRPFIQRRHFNGLFISTVAVGLFTGPATAQSEEKRLLVVGDSLSAEYGIAKGTGWVALLQKRLTERRPHWRVINASVSGDTTAGGRSRLPSLLKQHRPHWVIIELGGNDALRGLPLQASEANLQAMIKAATSVSAKVLLVGMEMPPNYGTHYVRQFKELYSRIAQTQSVQLVPFLLKGIADLPNANDWFQADRIHPLAKAHPKMLDNVWQVLEPLL